MRPSREFLETPHFLILSNEGIFWTAIQVAVHFSVNLWRIWLIIIKGFIGLFPLFLSMYALQTGARKPKIEEVESPKNYSDFFWKMMKWNGFVTVKFICADIFFMFLSKFFVQANWQALRSHVSIPALALGTMGFFTQDFGICLAILTIGFGMRGAIYSGHIKSVLLLSQNFSGKLH